MKSKIRFFFHYILFLCWIVLYCLFSLSGDKAGGPFWQGYYLFFIPGSVQLEKVIGDLREAFKPEGIFSSATTGVSITRFDSMEEIKIRDLDNRLDSLDPRLDPYIRSVRGLFGLNPGWELVGMAAKVPAFICYWKIRQLNHSQGYGIFFPGFHPLEKGLVIGLAVLFVLTLLPAAGVRQPVLLKWLSLLPWVFYLLAGDFFSLLIFMILFPCWLLLLEEGALFLEELIIYHRLSFMELGLKIPVFLFALSLGIVLCLRLPELSFPLFPLLACGALAAGFFSLTLQLKKQRSHHLFKVVPLPGLLRLKFPQIKIRNIVFILELILVITFIPFYYNTSFGSNMINIPVPVKFKPNRHSGIENFETMAAYQMNESLPTLSSYLAHLAYQQSLGFGGAYESAVQSGVFIDSYHAETKGISQSRLRPLIFDHAWQRLNLSLLPPDSLERLLASQDSTLGMDLLPERELFKRKGSYLREIIIYFFLLFPLFFLYLYLTPPLLYGIKNSFIRRKHSTA